ncbi:thiosulfate reductase cytochrome b subunit [Microbacterium ginsengiterrae]|uniref:Thiosulfate reductase cytochrome b subunit n=1 Tax=Microbacterium ginsengiterrae TaxID=546115 RepID=A0A7W9CB17_9MICO|nr:cytochrome b/b6 domain-containing protein [Microbacterium ginsengiterrae]MBB5742313.1 thiosulfate reductase cytochrome b subunit [Microbacterium ginsengiterrae]
MATRTLRRGLPRVVGGDPWPPAGEIEVSDAAAPAAAAPDAAPEAAPAEEGVDSLTVAQPVPSPAAAQPPQGEPQVQPGGGVTLRRGLPRTPGGEPWPPGDPAAAPAEPPRGVERAEGETKRVERAERVEASAPATAAPATPAAAASGPATAPAASVPGETLRRGLPRTPGGEPWPPAGTTAVVAAPVAEAGVDSPTLTQSVSSAAAESPAQGDPLAAPSTAVAAIDVSTPLPFQRTVFPGKTAFTRSAPKPEPERIGPFTKVQWAGAVIVGGIALLGAAAMAVFFVRWLLSTGPMQDFLATYPGEYHLPEGAPVGFPGWLAWQHFFNVFLMVLIIRSGLRIRTEKRPTAFWTPRNDPKGKVSLTIWFHQSLDILWLVNGVVFIVLLFVTGQWMRVIPTSWEVFPNALSAVLQYISLDWPTENGWVNYNSIQQITYFVTIFVAAPLAAVTGFRMSGMWPKNAEKLSRAYPIEWARAVHFPVMLYFVVFIAIHVFLVLATGALRNLNHMYAAQGSVDPNAYADNWTGFWFLVASLVVIAAAWVAARPLVLAPIAKLFGSVSAR